MSFHVTASRAVALGTTFCLTAGLGGLVSPTASVATVNQISYGPNGSINALLADGVGGAYVGGAFDGWGYQTGGLAAIGGDVTAAPDLTFPDVDGYVFAIEPDGTGGYFLGGSFNAVGGEDRENLAHIDVNGNVTDWAPETSGDGINDDTDGTVFTLALDLDRGVVFAGGRFLRVWDEEADDFRTQPLAAAFDADSAAVSNWNPGFSGDGSGGWFNLVNEGVWDFHILGTKLFVGGAFNELTLPTVVARSGIAAFDLDTLTDVSNGLTAFAPNPDGPVLAMETSPGGELLIGGIFENVGVTPVLSMSFAEIDADNAEATTFNVPVTSLDGSTVYPGQVEAIAVNSTNILIGGWFDEVGGVSRPNLALVSSGGAVNVWNPAPDAGVEAIAVSGGSYYVAGSFSNIAAQPREGVAKFNSSLIFDSAWDPGVDDSVSVISVTDTGVLIGGYFDLVGTTTAQQLVRVTSSGTLDDSFEADSSMEIGYYNSEVTALEMWSGELAVARTAFDSSTDNPADSLEWLDPSSGASTSRLPFVPNGTIYTLVAGARLYAGGSFTSVDPPGVASAEARTYGFGVLADGQSLAAWAPAFAGPVNELLLDGDFVYAVGEGPGNGSYVGGTPFAVRAATLEVGALDNSWSVDFSRGGTAQFGRVFSIAAWAGGLAIGGRMLTGTVSDNGFSLLGVSTVDASITWQSSINGRSSTNALVPRINSLIVGGTASLNSSDTFSPPFDLAILDQPTPPATRTTWQPEAPNDVNAVVISGSNLFVGGRSGLLITPVPVDSPNGGGGGGGGTGGGGSSETPIVNSSTAETTTDTQTFGPDTSLTLRPGEVAAIVNGVREPAMGSAGRDYKSLIVTWGGSMIDVPSPAGLGGSGDPQWQPGLATSLDVSGFQPETVTDAYLLSSPQLIGSVAATASGTGSIAVTVPATMKMGSHTLQVVGKDSRGRSLIIAVGLTVEKATKLMGTRVYFPIGSSKLTRSAKATLRSMINQVKAEGMLNSSAKVSGLVRLTGAKSSDIQLAKKRARSVSAYMKSLGFTGNVQTTTTRAPVRDRWSDRRVDISVNIH